MRKKIKKPVTTTPSRRKPTDKALRDSEDRFRLLVENSPDVIMTVDRDSTILFINYTLPEYTVESVLEKTAVSFLPTKDGPRRNSERAKSRIAPC